MYLIFKCHIFWYSYFNYNFKNLALKPSLGLPKWKEPNDKLSKQKTLKFK